MNKWIIILLIAFMWYAADQLAIDRRAAQLNRLQTQVNQLTTEQMQLNRQVRELWEAQEKLLWVSQDIDRRLIGVGR